MQDCQYLAKCPIWNQFNDNLSYVWITTYCQGNKQGACSRKMTKEAGLVVPFNLLPNGDYLPEELLAQKNTA